MSGYSTKADAGGSKDPNVIREITLENARGRKPQQLGDDLGQWMLTNAANQSQFWGDNYNHDRLDLNEVA